MRYPLNKLFFLLTILMMLSFGTFASAQDEDATSETESAEKKQKALEAQEAQKIEEAKQKLTEEPNADFAAKPGERPRLLVLDLKPVGVDKTIAKSLSGILAMEVERLDKFEIISQDEIRAALKVEEMKQLLGVEEGDGKIKNVGDALNAPYLLSGQLGKVGNTYLLSLTLIDTETAKAVRRVKQTLVGKREALIGSLRSAAIAMALEEKGVAPDITETLIQELHIAEKEKTMFFHLRPGYEIPVGPTKDDATLQYFLPSFFHIDLDATYMLRQWFGIGLSTGFALSIDEAHDSLTKQASMENMDADNESEGKHVTAFTSYNEFEAYRVPIDLTLRFQPPSGRFLPYFVFGIGVSWNRYSFQDEQMELLQRDTLVKQGNACPAGYHDNGEGACHLDATAQGYTFDPETGNNSLSLNLKPEKTNVDFWGLDVLAAAGFDFLITEHLGFSLEMRYLMVYSFKSERDMDPIFKATGIQTPSSYDPVNDTSERNYGDTTPIRRLHHGIMANIGMTIYF